MARAAIAESSYVEPSRQPFGDYLMGEWLPAIRSTVRPSTFESYGSLLRLHVVPTLGSVQLKELTAPKLNARTAASSQMAVSGTRVDSIAGWSERHPGGEQEAGMVVEQRHGPRLGTGSEPQLRGVDLPQIVRDLALGAFVRLRSPARMIGDEVMRRSAWCTVEIAGGSTPARDSSAAIRLAPTGMLLAELADLELECDVDPPGGS